MTFALENKAVAAERWAQRCAEDGGDLPQFIVQPADATHLSVRWGLRCGGDSGASGGDSGASGGDSGASGGDSGASGGDSGARGVGGREGARPDSARADSGPRAPRAARGEG
eukprot:gene13356-biopygen6542